MRGDMTDNLRDFKNLALDNRVVYLLPTLGSVENLLRLPRGLLEHQSKHYRGFWERPGNHTYKHNNQEFVFPMEQYSAAAVEVLAYWIWREEMPKMVESSNKPGVRHRHDPKNTVPPSLIRTWLEAWLLLDDLGMRRAQNAAMVKMCELVSQQDRRDDRSNPFVQIDDYREIVKELEQKKTGSQSHKIVETFFWEANRLTGGEVSEGSKMKRWFAKEKAIECIGAVLKGQKEESEKKGGTWLLVGEEDECAKG